MEIKATLSEEAVKVIEGALDAMRHYEFDAVAPVFILSAFCDVPISGFVDYFLDKEISSDDIDNQISAMLNDFLNDNSEPKEVKVEEDGEKSKEDRVASIGEFYILKSIYAADITINDYTDKQWRIPVTEEAQKIFEKLRDICAKKEIEKIKAAHILAACFETCDETFEQFFVDLALNYSEAKRKFTEEAIYSNGIIPYKLDSFLSNMNSKVDASRPCPILKRDNEVSKVWRVCQKYKKRNTVLIGEPGVGKSAIIELMAYQIVTGTCPERFKGFNVICLDVNSLIAGTKWRGDAEDRIKELIGFLEDHDNVILFIDEVHTILGAGSCFEGEMDLANALKPILARGDTIVIGATTEEEYNKYFVGDAALARRFEIVTIEEPYSKDVYSMIENQIKDLSAHHGVTISKGMVEKAILYSTAFSSHKRNPDKTLDLIDQSMVIAAETGKKRVDKACIIENFDILFDLVEGMSMESKQQIAYHEIGHVLVWLESTLLVDQRLLAVSIMPTKAYDGGTVFETVRDELPFENLLYYKDFVACLLGGRVAENLLHGDYTRGAEKDLQEAKEMSLNIVTKFGLPLNDSDKEKRYNVIFNSEEYPMFSELIKNQTESEARAFLAEAYKRAEEIINQHKAFIEALAKELVKKQIMSGDEVIKLWDEYNATRNVE